MVVAMRRILLLLLVVVLTGCATPSPTQDTPLPEITLTPTVTPIATQEITDPPVEGPVTLRMWVPPQFDPQNDSPEGALFQARLDEFISRKPNVNIEVRVKAVEGYGGILDTLSTANTAAPLALPDLVALPRYGLETAANSGVLHPYDGLTTILDDPDWYGFARQLSHLSNSTFGIPFAGDALLMAYRPEVLGDPPTDWAESLVITSTMAFPAADPESLFTLVQYQSLGGPILDESEQPVLDTVILTNVLTYYQQASATELMPFWLTQYETDEQAWEAYNQAQADMVITWASRYFKTALADTSAVPIATFDGAPFTLADGWAWALTTNDPDRQLLAAQLAEFLTTSEYLSAWTAAAGLIPPRPSALADWMHIPSQTLVNKIAPTAQLIPSQEIVSVYGPILQQATVSVLKAEADPITAAENAVGKLTNP
jgi:ABC-type glycerol-3-phosphate transport system substrate-binding protein